MNVSEHEKLYIAREIVLSWVTGNVITLMLVVLRAIHIAPGATDILLRPGLYLARAVHGKSVLSTVVLALRRRSHLWVAAIRRHASAVEAAPAAQPHAGAKGQTSQFSNGARHARIRVRMAGR